MTIDWPIVAIVAMLVLVYLSIRDHRISSAIMRVLDDGIDRTVTGIQTGISERYRLNVGLPHIKNILRALADAGHVEKVQGVDQGGRPWTRWRIVTAQRRVRYGQRRGWYK